MHAYGQNCLLTVFFRQCVTVNVIMMMFMKVFMVSVLLCILVFCCRCFLCQCCLCMFVRHGFFLEKAVQGCVFLLLLQEEQCTDVWLFCCP